MICKYSLHSVGFLFSLLMVYFNIQKFLILMKSKLSSFVCAKLMLLVSHLKNNCHEDFPSAYSSKSFIVLALKFRSLS